MLKTNKPLTQLDLANDCVYLAGAKALIQSLAGNTTLKHLSLVKNSITSEGQRACTVSPMLFCPEALFCVVQAPRLLRRFFRLIAL